MEVVDRDVNLFRRYLGREDITKEEVEKRATEARSKALQVCNYRYFNCAHIQIRVINPF